MVTTEALVYRIKGNAHQTEPGDPGRAFNVEAVKHEKYSSSSIRPVEDALGGEMISLSLFFF